MQTPDPTLHDFVLKLLSDAGCREAFDLDPVQALSAAGLPDVAPQDVLDAVPLVMDFASASGDGLNFDGAAWGNLSSVGGWGTVESEWGNGAASAELTPDHGVHSGANFGLPDGSAWAGEEFTIGPDGVSGAGHWNSPLGGGSYSFEGGLNGFDGELHLSGLDSDTIGRGGDLVTGTVAGFVTDGADTFAGMLTEGAGALTDHLHDGAHTGGDMITDGADTLAGAITDGAGLLSETLQDPTSLHVPTLPAAGLPDLTGALPVDLPALPAAPHLPGLGDLPISLPDLPVDLPVGLPSLPALPAVPGASAAPGLPSLPGVDAVHDTVAGVTSNVPLVGDLTDGLTDHLPLGH